MQVAQLASSVGTLGIPEDARRVLLFCESSHWDTNWLRTSNEYFERRIEPIAAKVIAALEDDPQRIYGVESVFFLKLYWERHPEDRQRLRALVEGRQLRILSSSFTTPDTLLPHPEAILRDFHLGQRWLSDVGLGVVPRTAYFPDNFGHSPHLPSLMRAVGVDSVALTRIDGMYFIASDFRARSRFPMPGSTAELLQKELRTLDFVWRDDDGAEVLCHWNAFTYFQGDMIAHAGIVRWNGHVAAIPWRTRRHVARRIDGFVKQLEPLARTRYLLCPIGMDFNDPIEGLGSLLERYNRERYGVTGTWAVLAGLDDYFDLVRAHTRDLPVLAVDPNPYWMGFYASRPELKQRPTRIARTLVLAEKLSALAPEDPALEASLRQAWSTLVLMNHHDAITGTSTDRVCEEQVGWLDTAEAAADQALSSASGGAVRRAASEPAPAPAAAAPRGATRERWWREGPLFHVRTAHHTLTFSEELGGCLVSLVALGREQLGGLGFDLLAFADEGGLWRLGHEYRGGRFALVDRASRRPAKIEVFASADAIRLVIASEIQGSPFIRTVTCARDDRFIRVSVAGVLRRRLTVTCRVDVVGDPVSLEMDTIGGTIERPRERVHEPTFWPVPSMISLVGAAQSLHVNFEAATAVSFSPDHALEWIVARNATKERAFRILPVLAHPIGGTGDERQVHHAALFVTHEPYVSAAMRRELEVAWFPADQRCLKHLVRRLVRCDDPAIGFSAMKRADAGQGVIVRLACVRRGCPPARTVRLWIPSREIREAYLCNARERDLERLELDGGRAVVHVASRLTTVRLILATNRANEVRESRELPP
jgi:hypothetical protein